MPDLKTLFRHLKIFFQRTISTNTQCDTIIPGGSGSIPIFFVNAANKVSDVLFCRERGRLARPMQPRRLHSQALLLKQPVYKKMGMLPVDQ